MLLVAKLGVYLRIEKVGEVPYVGKNIATIKWPACRYVL